MIVDISSQINFFLIAFILGFFSAILFDIFRIFRKSLKHNKFFINLEDLIFWVFTTFIFYYVFLHKNNGDIRGYMLISLLLGFIFEIIVFSKTFIKFGEKIVVFLVNIFKEILLLILQPLSFLCKMGVDTFKSYILKFKGATKDKYIKGKTKVFTLSKNKGKNGKDYEK
ncbi:MAG: spore cortex biosynthesis protein YabQ [Lachnospirales bacterium]